MIKLALRITLLVALIIGAPTLYAQKQELTAEEKARIAEQRKVVEELEESAFLPFATQRGHHARRIFLFLEDVSEMLSRFGFYLEPRRFSWDQQHIFPLMPNGPTGPY